MSFSRRSLIKALSVTAAGSALRRVPLTAAEKAHRMVNAEKAASSASSYVPKFFPPRQYETLRALCQAIMPPDQESGGAVEAGAPEFIDLLTSENKELQLQLDGGIMCLDSTCSERYGRSFLDCTAEERKEILDLISFRQEWREASAAPSGGRFFLDAPKVHCRWVLHQRNRYEVPRLHWQHLPERVPRLSSGAKKLKLRELLVGKQDGGHKTGMQINNDLLPAYLWPGGFPVVRDG